MSSNAYFSVTMPGIDKLIKELAATPAEIDRATIRAINRTAKTGKARIADAVTEATNLKRGSVLEVIKITNARKGNPAALIAMKDSPRPAYVFKGTRAGKRGVSVQFYKG